MHRNGLVFDNVHVSERQGTWYTHDDVTDKGTQEDV